jgi:hypothetical protein
MAEQTPQEDLIPCCPPLVKADCCDVIDFRNRLLFPTSVRTEQGQQVNVEVVIHTRLSRCPGPLTLGDPIYSTTLLPGEKVRLATTDRRSRFSFDSASNLSYRDEHVSEEQYHMSAFRAFVFDASATDAGHARDTDQGSWDFHGDASGSIGLFSASADANARGSHNAESTHDFLNQHKAHSESSERQAVEATHKAHSMSIGEVSSRAHAEGQSEDHFESSSREFQNKNQCHAVTFLFYRLNKTQTVKYTIEAIERRVIDPAAPNRVLNSPVKARGDIHVIPQSIPATSTTRLETEAIGRSSVVANEHLPTAQAVGIAGAPFDSTQPISAAARAQALKEVDAQLSAPGIGLIDPQTGKVSAQARKEFNWEHQSCLPTAGVIVKGCLDECDVCEPALAKSIELDLERKALENQLLKKKIDLLEKSQEYRCCPADEEETVNP